MEAALCRCPGAKSPDPIFQLVNPPMGKRVSSLILQVKKAMETRGHSNSDLAALLGTHRQAVYRWLSGKLEPSGEVTLALTEYIEKTK
jgi:ribosome-binding protein aMBF1 (putative translation factor)